MPARRHILIAESDSSVRALLARMVARIYPDTDIMMVTDGTAALAVFETGSADLLIATQRLPVLSGIQVVRALRTRGVAIPILLMSSDPLEAEAIAAGATHFLRKPFTLTQIRTVLTELLPP